MKKENILNLILVIALAATVAVGTVSAATTISTDIATEGVLTVSGTASSSFLGAVGIGTLSPLAKLHIGGYTANNSVDSQVLISRNIDNTISGNGHAFSDSSNLNRSGTIGYNSYDARITVSGSNNYDHYAAFQAGPTYGGSGTINDLYGLVNIPAINSGTVTNSYGLDVWDPTGAGTLTNNYGVHVAPLTKGANNFAIYTGGTTKSYFGGNVGIGTTSPSEKLDVAGNSVVGRSPDSGTSAFSAIYDHTETGYIAMQKRGSAEAGLMGSPAGNSELFSVNSNLGLLTHTAGKYLALGTANTERMRISATGLVGIGTTGATEMLDINSNNIRVRTAKTPSSATDTCDQGEISWDANYTYVCVATNTWKRSALTTW